MVKRTYGTLPPPAPPAPERRPLGAPAGHSGVNNTPQLLPCPFCGAPAHGYAIAPHSHSPAVLRLVPELPDHPGCYVIEGQCACGSGLIGANESEVTARWNRRTPQQEAQEPATVPYQKLTNEIDLILSDQDTDLSIGAKRALLWMRTWVSVPLYTAPQQEAQEPYAYAVYFPDQPKVELVHDLDELIDDLTNRPHAVTKLYATPQPAPAPLSDDTKDAARWRWLSEHIGVAWNEGKFTSLVRIVSDKNRTALNASIDRMMAGDWSYAALAAQGGE